MNRNVIAIAGAVALLVVAWLYLWYNKDRYEFIHYTKEKIGSHTITTTYVFDKNTGVFYDLDGLVDYPNSRVQTGRSKNR